MPIRNNTEQTELKKLTEVTDQEQQGLFRDALKQIAVAENKSSSRNHGRETRSAGKLFLDRAALKDGDMKKELVDSPTDKEALEILKHPPIKKVKRTSLYMGEQNDPDIFWDEESLEIQGVEIEKAVYIYMKTRIGELMAQGIISLPVIIARLNINLQTPIRNVVIIQAYNEILKEIMDATQSMPIAAYFQGALLSFQNIQADIADYADAGKKRLSPRDYLAAKKLQADLAEKVIKVFEMLGVGWNPLTGATVIRAGYGGSGLSGGESSKLSRPLGELVDRNLAYDKNLDEDD